MIQTLKVGETHQTKRHITPSDVQAFATVTGDFNPAHFDAAYAATTRFKKPIVHGMLLGSLFSPIFGMKSPGEGTIYCQQSLTFLKPVYIGEQITIEVTLERVDVEKNRAYYRTEILNEALEIAVTGCAMMMPKKESKHV